MGALVSCFSNILYISEKISLWVACTGLICCLVLTLTVTLGLGIGLGYNYCFVGMRNRVKTHVKGHLAWPGDPRWRDHPRWRDPAWRYPRREGAAPDYQGTEERSEDEAYPSNVYTTLISPGVDLRNSDKSVNIDYRPSFSDLDNLNIDYHPFFSDLESFNKTESALKSTVDVAKNDESTEISESISETSVTTEKRYAVTTTTSSFLESSSTTVTTVKAEVINEINEPPPEPIDQRTTPMVNDPRSRKVRKPVIPITGLDLISLLTKLSAENKNYSLQIVTTRATLS